ncbi:hypothetical protein [Kitasatospora sp. NPDC004272]
MPRLVAVGRITAGSPPQITVSADAPPAMQQPAPAAPAAPPVPAQPQRR